MFSLILASLLLAAQQPNCSDPRTQAEMNECAAREANAADADLNLIYKAVVTHYEQMDREAETTEGVKRLRAAQRAWVGFRDAQCAVAGYEALGGSMESLLVSGCVAELTKRRATELRIMLSGR
ncbi:MAG TPA: lysozyme inhibitor LprI family protein [Allosphingosinicella sp.]|nr:lysozyme inhibitor LprI family protein [Allosphingosinicella sp.]